ncbi:MAG: chemotaxis protein CheX [Candidatus Dadabacteria bacterium]|nr:MAG: chemotaxis protein CheX [Candidatus Dadabacteria bacterium]
MEDNAVSDFKTIIYEVSARILEDWGMMMVDPAPEETQIFDFNEPFYLATIQFHGLMSGRYTVICQKAFMQTLAANLLGDDQAEDGKDSLDALKEMANVLCGNLLTECYGEDAVFDLVLPEVTKVDGEQVKQLFSDRTVSYLADDEPVAVTFDLQGE